MAALGAPHIAHAPGLNAAFAAPRLAAPSPAASGMTPWPIGLTAVARPVPPDLSAPHVATRLALATPPSTSSPAARALRAPIRAPLPEERVAPARHIAGSLFSDVIGFLRETASRERPPQTDWESARD